MISEGAPALGRPLSVTFRAKLYMSRLCGLLLLLRLLTLALGIALANSGNLDVDGYPFKKVLIVIFENTDYQEVISQPSFLRIA
jgi:hypothetical protein